MAHWNNRKCVICETEFYGRYGAKTCSSACRQKKYRMDKKADLIDGVTDNGSDKCNASQASVTDLKRNAGSMIGQNRVFYRVGGK